MTRPAATPSTPDLARDRIAAILPSVRRDLPRARILLRSLARYAHPFGPVWIATPGGDVAAFREAAAACAGAVDVRVVDEREIVPELGRCVWLRGWMRQQLVKLAVAHRVDTAFYLTLDSDVVLTRDVALGELVEHDRAPYALMGPTPHLDWYRGSWGLLGLPPKDEQREHNVTPAILSTRGVLELAAALDARVQSGAYSPGRRGLAQRAVLALRGLAFPRDARAWTLFLAASPPWTEYSLYYAWLESTGTLERHHRLVERPVYDLDFSVTKKHPYHFYERDWSAKFQRGAEAGALAARPPFVIVQSAAKTPVDEVEAALLPQLEPA